MKTLGGNVDWRQTKWGFMFPELNEILFRHSTVFKCPPLEHRGAVVSNVSLQQDGLGFESPG